MNLCDFCGEEHPHGVSQTMVDAGHPFLTSHSRVMGFGYKIRGREESLTDAEVKAARHNGWRK